MTVPARTGRRAALGRLATAATAATLPAVVEATPALPDWLADRPEWFVDNIARYARALDALDRPEDPWLDGSAEVRDDILTRRVARLVAEMNAVRAAAASQGTRAGRPRKTWRAVRTRCYKPRHRT